MIILSKGTGGIFWFTLICIFLIGNCAHGISIPYFGSFLSRPTTTPSYEQSKKEARIINADHGAGGASSVSVASGNPGPSSQWVSGTRDQFIHDQLVILHPDSTLNKASWKESGYLQPEYNVSPQPVPTRTVKTTHGPTQRVRKTTRKSKQEQQAPVVREGAATSIPMPTPQQEEMEMFLGYNPVPSVGLYEAPPSVSLRDSGSGRDEAPVPYYHSHEPIFIHANNFFTPLTRTFSHTLFPFSPRANSQPLPPEAVIQFLKSPEQELSASTRPQVKLPFPLSHDCGSGSGSKPLQFVVLPIVEPVTPLKPVIPKPSFLSSQYGQFPYIPPFNLFKNPPVATPQNVGESIASSGSSGHFVPIMNRPAPPLPFVFVQSLPLELIGQNTDLDILQASNSPEGKVKESVVPSPVESAPIPSATRPLPLIVIEKVKGSGSSSSPPVPPLVEGISPAAAVEITKQSIQKNNASPPLSTISVVQPITTGKDSQQVEEIHKAIEKLVPVAAAVLQNLEQQQKEKNGNPPAKSTDNNAQGPTDLQGGVISKELKSKPEVPLVGTVGKPSEPKNSSLRPPLRPDNQSHESTSNSAYKKPDSSSGEEIGSTTLSEVEVTEA